MSYSADFGPTADDYAAFRAGFPAACFDRLRALGIGLPGQRVVDLGTGTGALARGLAGAGARVVGIDPKAEMLAAARRLAEDEELDIAFERGSAE